MEPEKRIITYQSKDYHKSVELRDKILRKPLGMIFSEEFLAEDKKEHILGLFDNHKILATLNLKPVSNTSIKMRQVAVDDRLQGKGLGGILVEFSEEYALNNGFNEIVLHARDTAVNFYLNLDYEITDKDFFYEVGIAHLKMRKKLKPKK